MTVRAISRHAALEAWADDSLAKGDIVYRDHYTGFVIYCGPATAVIQTAMTAALRAARDFAKANGIKGARIVPDVIMTTCPQHNPDFGHNLPLGLDGAALYPTLTARLAWACAHLGGDDGISLHQAVFQGIGRDQLKQIVKQLSLDHPASQAA